MTEPADARTLYLIDGSAFIFRAFHAMQPLTRPDGTPVNAVYGFCNMLWRLMEQFGEHRYAVIFDAQRTNFRNDIYADYKANRTDPPEDLVPQFPLTRDASRAFGLPCVEVEGFEADDLIATYARLATAQGLTSVIVSSDKDLLQLVSPSVSMYDPMKQITLGAEAVQEKFGVGPDKVVDVQALAGDSVDNVPGVPGIGLKTAAQLINEFGDLDTLLAQAESIKQKKRRENLIAFADQARLSRRLVQLDDHAPVSLSDLDTPDADPEKLLSFLQDQNFRSLLTRVREAWAKKGQAVALPQPVETAAAPTSGEQADDKQYQPGQPPEVGEPDYHLIQDTQTLRAWIAEAWEAGRIGLDCETDSLRAATAGLVGISLATRPGRAAYLPLAHVAGPADQLDLSGEGVAVPDQIPLDDALGLLKPLLEDRSILKIGHNLKFDLQLFQRHGIQVAPVDDTMLISYVLFGRSHDQGLDFLTQRYLGHSNISFEAVAGKGKAQIPFPQVTLETARDYAAEDADMTLRLWHVFRPRLVSERMVSVYERIERPLIPLVAEMERTGITVDPQILRTMSGRFSEQLGVLEADIHLLAGQTFNIGSPKQVGEVLFDALGLPHGTKTKTGAWSTASDVLEPLAEQGHEVVEKILEWRELSKLKSTYTDALQKEIAPQTGRVHTSFQMAVTNTGRLSSTDPNLQNIPIRTEAGRRIRTAFVAPPGHRLMSVDYSQIELRLVAEMADVAALKQAFRDGVDIHSLTASQVFGIPLAEMTSDIRRKAKAINFGIIYGISGYGLGKQLGVGAGEANAFIKDYLTRFHEIQSYMEEQKEFCREHKYVLTLFGRKVFIPEIKDRNQARRSFAERQAINAPIQGTAADIIKQAMVAVDRRIKADNLPARLLLQVHDELVFEVPEEAAETVGTLVKATMEEAVTLSIPLDAEVGFGPNWAEAH